MSMQLIGTVKNGDVYEVTGKDGSKKSMISFNVVDGLGNLYPCQMWPDDPQFNDLSSVIASYRRQHIQLTIVSYTSRMRQFQDGQIRPWTNFIVSEVGQPAQGSVLSASFSGTVKAGNRAQYEGKKPYCWLTVVDEVGTTFACKLWSDDPHFEEVASVLQAGARRQQVQFLIESFSTRERTVNGQTSVQLGFNVSDVVFPALVRA